MCLVRTFFFVVEEEKKRLWQVSFSHSSSHAIIFFPVSCRTQETNKTQCVSIKGATTPSLFNHVVICIGHKDRSEIDGQPVIEERGAGLMHYVPLVWSERSATGPRGISQRTFSTRHSEEDSSTDQGSTFWTQSYKTFRRSLRRVTLYNCLSWTSK